jgi:septal ring factor EnvC (AmiA/AmiB activator)
MQTRFFVLLQIFLFSILLSASLAIPTHRATALTQAEQEAEWRSELAQTEADIAKWQAILDGTKANTASLQRDAAVLNAKIKQAQAFIKQRQIAIAQLGVDISQKNQTITDLQAKIDGGHDSLGQLLRKTNEIDQFSLPEVVLGGKDISDFFADLDSFDSIKRDMKTLFAEIRQNKDLTEKEKAALAQKQTQEADTQAAMEAQKRQVQKDEQQKQYLISVSKTQEKTYAQVLAEQQAKAGQIRAKLPSHSAPL